MTSLLHKRNISPSRLEGEGTPGTSKSCVDLVQGTNTKNTTDLSSKEGLLFKKIMIWEDFQKRVKHLERLYFCWSKFLAFITLNFYRDVGQDHYQSSEDSSVPVFLYSHGVLIIERIFSFQFSELYWKILECNASSTR